MAGMLARLVKPFTREKQMGGFPLPVTGGWLSPVAGQYMNWWQMGYDPVGGSGSATVQACISCYAQTIAMCPGTHWRTTPDGGRERVRTSPLSRILRRPNSYQSISDFFLNLVGMLYEEGNAYALALRDSSFKISELHLMDPRLSWPRISTTGEIFYHLAGNEMVERMIGPAALEIVPSRDVLHLRLNARRHPLKGESPLEAALMDIAASNAMVSQALAFVQNQGRPSGIIETDLNLNTQDAQEVRLAWDRQTKGENAGGTPILTNKLKWKAVPAQSSRDEQLAERLQISDQRVASVYRVPLALLSLMSGNGPQGSTQSLMQYWVSTGLGFGVNHVEEGVGQLFGLAGYPDEYLELDTNILLRSSLKERLEALSAGTHRVYTINEARALEGLPRVDGGDDVRVQQQDVPLDAWDKMQPQTPRPDAPPASPSADAAPADNSAATRLWARQILDAAERNDRAAA